MKTYFISSDIHGFYTYWKDALKEAGFNEDNPEHILIILGDLFDRGYENLKVLNFCKDMLLKDRIILIRGNHEDLLMDLVDGRREISRAVDSRNGTTGTIAEFCGVDPCYIEILFDAEYNNFKKKIDSTGLQDVVNNMKDYYEGNHYIFVHGWIPSCEKNDKPTYDPSWRNATENEWKLARWDNGMAMAENGVIEPNKTIVCGHWHCSWGNKKLNPELEEYPDLKVPGWEKSFVPYQNKGIIAVDTCTVYTHKVNVLKLTEEEI